MHYSKWHPTFLAHLKPVSKSVYAPEWRFVLLRARNKVDQLQTKSKMVFTTKLVLSRLPPALLWAQVGR